MATVVTVLGVSMLIGGLVVAALKIWTWTTPLDGMNPHQRFMEPILKWYSLFMAFVMTGLGFFILIQPDPSPFAIKVLAFGGGIMVALVGIALATLSPWVRRYMFRRFYHGQWPRILLALTIAALEGFAIMLLSIETLMLPLGWPLPFFNAMLVVIGLSVAVWFVSTLAVVAVVA